jgi:hypothetical protein
MTQGLDNGNCASTTSPGPRPLSVPDVDKLQLHGPCIDSYRFSMANLEGMLGSIGTTHFNGPFIGIQMIYGADIGALSVASRSASRTREVFVSFNQMITSGRTTNGQHFHGRSDRRNAPDSRHIKGINHRIFHSCISLALTSRNCDGTS